jgi:hypothetical protein
VNVKTAKDSSLLACDAVIFKGQTVPLTFEDEGITILRNVGNYSPKNTASHPGRVESSKTPL